nr:FG-GAP-like repeat-containing protein [Cylindrospermum stagnale]
MANPGSYNISVRLRNATNTDFYAATSFSIGYIPFSITVGDFNGDRKLDLATANYNGSVSVLLRNAANTGFDPATNFSVGTNPYSVTVGDFNGDGKSDLVVANSSSNNVSVLLRNAANTSFDPATNFSVGSGPGSVTVGDFNGDGKSDLAVANSSSDNVSVLLNADPAATLTITDVPANQAPITGNGRNPLTGTTGDDIIIGGPGAKTLTGNRGNDVFVFTNLKDVGQRIADFGVGDDKIDLSQLLTSIGYEGTDPIADGYVQFVQGSTANSTVLQIDRDGAFGTAIFKNFLQLDNVTPTQMNDPNNFVFGNNIQP